MKGSSLFCAALCALLSYSSGSAHASAPSPFMPAPRAVRPPHGGGIRFETPRPHGSEEGISLGEVVYGPIEPTTEATPDSQPQIVGVPVYIPVPTQTAEAPSRGPHIIYIGPETERQKHGAMPQIIYGDIPARTANGPQVIYGDSWR